MSVEEEREAMLPCAIAEGRRIIQHKLKETLEGLNLAGWFVVVFTSTGDALTILRMDECQWTNLLSIFPEVMRRSMQLNKIKISDN